MTNIGARTGIAAFVAAGIFATAALAAVITDVAHVGGMRLGSRVTLQGNIVQHIRDDYYKFQDGSGSIRVEIEGWARRGRTFHPATKVQISGEVSRGFFGRYIEVSRVTTLK